MDEKAGPQVEATSAGLGRYAPLARGLSVALIVVSVLLLLRRLPVAAALAAVEDEIKDLGLWGPVVFGLGYVLAVVLLFPAAVLTLAAGALFGLVVATIVVSLAATTGAALAFLISRYMARDWVARKIMHYPRFAAIDRAISTGGWRIVALLRLSPAVPFNLQNYLYGVTGIRFGPYVLTSWLCMLPGGFLYVYLGYLGRASAAVAAGSATRGTAQWILLIVGLVATVIVTVYVTVLARRALAQHTGMDPARLAAADPVQGPPQVPPRRWPWGTTLLAVIAVLMFGVALFVQFRPDFLTEWFGGPTSPADHAH